MAQPPQVLQYLIHDEAVYIDQTNLEGKRGSYPHPDIPGVYLNQHWAEYYYMATLLARAS